MDGGAIWGGAKSFKKGKDKENEIGRERERKWDTEEDQECEKEKETGKKLFKQRLERARGVAG